MDVQIQFRTLATAVAKLAKHVDDDADYAEFVGYVTHNATNEEGATRAERYQESDRGTDPRGEGSLCHKRRLSTEDFQMSNSY